MGDWFPGRWHGISLDTVGNGYPRPALVRAMGRNVPAARFRRLGGRT